MNDIFKVFVIGILFLYLNKMIVFCEILWKLKYEILLGNKVFIIFEELYELFWIYVL